MAPPVSKGKATQPNIVLFLRDNLSHGEVRCYGGGGAVRGPDTEGSMRSTRMACSLARERKIPSRSF
jgi:hypothetical protein